MRNPSPLPKQLHGHVFTRAQAQSLGVSDQRLRARDVERVARATYRHLPIDPTSRSTTAAVSPDPDRWEFLRALTQRSPNVWASHSTAAEAYGLPLPARVRRANHIHLTAVNHCLDSVTEPRIILHRARTRPAELGLTHGLRLSPMGRLFVETSAQLTLTEQICLGDHLVRRPRKAFEGRDEPLITREELSRAVKSQARRPGVIQARRALTLVRVGADSAPETLLRLALIEAGLPEPELQIPLDPGDPFSPIGDAGYRFLRLVIQYDGAHHFHLEQQAADQWRNAQFEAERWTVLLSNQVDLRENFSRVTARVRRLLVRAGA